MNNAEQEIEKVYEANDGAEFMEEYCGRHGIESLLILTITNSYAATREVDKFAHKIRGKTVVEIGAGVGFLAMEMARFAKRVYAIEADPSWNKVFTDCLYLMKPPNLTWIFGTAESVSEWLRGDIAVVFTRSGHGAMYAAARSMCPEIIEGPTLSIEDREPDVMPAILAEAKRIADTVRPEDFTSRRTFSVPEGKLIVEPE